MTLPEPLSLTACERGVQEDSRCQAKLLENPQVRVLIRTRLAYLHLQLVSHLHLQHFVQALVYLANISSC